MNHQLCLPTCLCQPTTAFKTPPTQAGIRTRTLPRSRGGGGGEQTNKPTLHASLQTSRYVTPPSGKTRSTQKRRSKPAVWLDRFKAAFPIQDWMVPFIQTPSTKHQVRRILNQVSSSTRLKGKEPRFFSETWCFKL